LDVPSLPFACDAAACVRRSLSLARGTAADHFDLVGVLDALVGIIEEFNYPEFHVSFTRSDISRRVVTKMDY
jgi:hypothetical protein